MAKKQSAGAQPNQSLIDGIAVLQALAISSEPVGGLELSRRLSFEPTRVNRLLKTLAYLDIARQTPDRKYVSGPGMTVLAAQSMFASGFVQKALPALSKLRRFGHTVAMGVLWRDNVSYLYHARPTMHETDGIGRIGLYPATLGGIGMTLLSQLSEDAIHGLYDGKDIPGYPSGISPLMDDLSRIKEEGFVRILVKDDQHTVAVPIGKPAYSAVAVSGWIPEESTGKVISTLEEVSDEINKGGTDNPTEIKATVNQSNTKYL